MNIAAGSSATGYGTVTANGTLNANGILTLLSDALGTAMVGRSNGTIDGEVTVQRYLGAYLSWRFVGIPFKKTSTETINQAWQEGYTDVVLQCNPYPQYPGTPGYGTAITFNNANGYDVHNNDYKPLDASISKQYLDNSSWVPNRTPLPEHRILTSLHILFFVRGDMNGV